VIIPPFSLHLPNARHADDDVRPSIRLVSHGQTIVGLELVERFDFTLVGLDGHFTILCHKAGFRLSVLVNSASEPQ
jgi:hypothetical protein